MIVNMNKNIATLVLGLILSVTAVYAQPNYDYGADSVNCVTNIFHYQQFTKQKLYDDALAPWEKLIEICPGSRKSLYTTGAKMLKALHKKEKDEAKKAELLDKLMMLYDKRIEVKEFGSEGYILGLKGVDMLRYFPDKLEEAMNTLKKSIDMQKNKSKASVLSSYFTSIFNGFKAEKVPVDKLLSEYGVVSDIISYNLNKLVPGDKKSEKKIADYKKAKDNIDTYFIAVAECEDIVPLYQEKLAASPDDLALNKKALSIMNKKDCLENDLFLKVAKFVHEKEPTAESASAIAKILLKNGDVDEALKYFDEAVSLCGDCPDKEAYLKNAGLISGSKGRHGKALGYAEQLLKLNPNSGTAYIIKGDAVKSKHKSCDDGKMGSKAVYWKAADFYNKAISIDPNEKVKEAARKKLGSCKSRYPTKEDLFFHGLKAGDSYTLPCTGATTTIRQSN